LELQRAGSAGQVEAERILFDLIVASFESLTPGSGGGVLLGKKEKLAHAIRENFRGGSGES
jgi:hypothetical protein